MANSTLSLPWPGRAAPGSFAEVIVAFVGGDAKDPVFEGRIAAVLAQLEVGLDKNVLADVLEFRRVARESGRHAEDPAPVTTREFRVGVIISRESRFHELFVRG